MKHTNEEAMKILSSCIVCSSTTLQRIDHLLSSFRKRSFLLDALLLLLLLLYGVICV